MLAAQDAVTIPLPLLIAVFVMLGGGTLSWFAYVMKQLVEHAKWMAAATEKMDHVAAEAEHHGDRLDRLELAAFRRGH